MKVQIRQNVFETNSSSMHSLVVKKETAGIDSGFKNVIKEHTIYLSEDDLYFGRYPFQLLNTVYDKIRYTFASFAEAMESNQEYAIDILNTMTDIVKKYDKDFKGFIFDTDISEHHNLNAEEINTYRDRGYSITKDTRGSENIIYCTKTNYGYVDHQSYGLLQSFLTNNELTIQEFIENPKYIVSVDGDEYNIFNDLLSSGVIDKNQIEITYSV